MIPTAAETARFLNAYARRFNGGAFATPPASELPGLLVDFWRDGQGRRTVAVTKVLTRDSVRTDWLGRAYTLPRGALIATHVAREPGAEVPDFGGFEYVFTYVEDAELTDGLRAQGRQVKAMRISATSELIACWADPGDCLPPVSPLDELATVVECGAPRAWTYDAAAAELTGLAGWADDYPYYSDGSWSALSLRGFDADPAWGVKPAEMGAKWNKVHPGALAKQCVWTELADRCPTMRELAETIPGAGLERVRLMRMRQGKLARHTDITDKASGLGDGQIARFHFPLVTSELVTLHTWELDGTARDHHLAAGQWYYLDARKPHAVTQADPNLDRIHLVADVICDGSTRLMLEAWCKAAT